MNDVLRDAGSDFRLMPAPNCPAAWADAVTLAQLTNHTALGMHYVWGVPPSRAGGMPGARALLEGAHEEELGYARLLVDKPPGERFAYSGGGFITLELVLEALLGAPVGAAARGFLDACGARAESFALDACAALTLAGDCAQGYYDDGALVRDGRLSFPPLAAGAHGTPAALARVLWHLGRAHTRAAGSGPISQRTAKLMLDAPQDLGAVDFMRAEVGLGVFVARAGPNRVMLHQAANDGFRGVYAVVFDGPDAADGPVGFVLLANGDNKAMFMNCEIALALLRRSGVRGVDPARVAGVTFDANVSQEQIVNLGLKELVFAAFEQ